MKQPINVQTAGALAHVACDCLNALKYLLERHDRSSLAIGILAGHCVEATLKARLAYAGWSESQLKDLGHDLLRCWAAAHFADMVVNELPPKWLVHINYGHSNLLYRYPDGKGLVGLPQPLDYTEALEELLEPLIADFMTIGGRYVNDF